MAPASQKNNQRTEQSLRTRQKILAVSLELFVHKGYAGTTVRDIAKNAGVSPGLLFHYFPSKQAVLEEHIRVVSSGVTSVAQLLAVADRPIETFAAIAGIILDSFQDDYSKNLFLLANQVMSLESIPASAKEILGGTMSVEASAPLIALGQQRGEIKQGDPLILALTFWGALQGTAEMLVWKPGVGVPPPEYIMRILRA